MNLKGPCNEIFNTGFLAYSFYLKALIVGAEMFLRKKIELVKIFGVVLDNSKKCLE